MTQLGSSKAQIKHKNKNITCKSFVLPGRGAALLGLLELELIPLLNMNYSIIHAPHEKKFKTLEQSATQTVIQKINLTNLITL